MTVAVPHPRASFFSAKWLGQEMHIPRNWSLAQQYLIASLLVVLAGVVLAVGLSALLTMSWGRAGLVLAVAVLQVALVVGWVVTAALEHLARVAVVDRQPLCDLQLSCANKDHMVPRRCCSGVGIDRPAVCGRPSSRSATLLPENAPEKL